jgi:hypothetical protein
MRFWENNFMEGLGSIRMDSGSVAGVDATITPLGANFLRIRRIYPFDSGGLHKCRLFGLGACTQPASLTGLPYFFGSGGGRSGSVFACGAAWSMFGVTSASTRPIAQLMPPVRTDWNSALCHMSSR